ncbi:hypothetical protein LTR62_002713 [Meristemomyces frigidus]|uniref:Uncharacterized protein n=1 Tax=Meristemomyces frigidus TaxID=1508187 RepID=A0AAN7YHF9_9PEZI|nr:hypothetical protein LTR62_002713 [Meristemomyces frigidus]
MSEGYIRAQVKRVLGEAFQEARVKKRTQPTVVSSGEVAHDILSDQEQLLEMATRAHERTEHDLDRVMVLIKDATPHVVDSISAAIEVQLIKTQRGPLSSRNRKNIGPTILVEYASLLAARYYLRWWKVRFAQGVERLMAEEAAEAQGFTFHLPLPGRRAAGSRRPTRAGAKRKVDDVKEKPQPAVGEIQTAAGKKRCTAAAAAPGSAPKLEMIVKLRVPHTAEDKVTRIINQKAKPAGAGNEVDDGLPMTANQAEGACATPKVRKLATLRLISELKGGDQKDNTNADAPGVGPARDGAETATTTPRVRRLRFQINGTLRNEE